jgi:hypothetical protein
VVVAYSWAVTHFGSAEAAIGKTLGNDAAPATIVGVAAPGFRYPGAADFWMALDARPAPSAPENTSSLQQTWETCRPPNVKRVMRLLRGLAKATGYLPDPS